MRVAAAERSSGKGQQTMINRRQNVRTAVAVLWIAGLMVALSGGIAAADDTVKLVANGQAVSVIVVSPQAAARELFAAQELAEYLEKISGGRPGCRAGECQGAAKNFSLKKQLKLVNKGGA